MKINLWNTEWHIEGESVAGKYTCLIIPELKVKLDAGVMTDMVAEHIFITHGHLDHIHHLASSLLDTGQVKPNVFMYEPISWKIHHYLSFAHALNRNKHPDKVKINWKPYKMKDDTTEMIKIKGMEMAIELIHCYHSIPT